MGDAQNNGEQWQDEEPEHASEDFEVSTGQELGQVSFRDSLRRLYKSERFQVNHNNPKLPPYIYINTGSTRIMFISCVD